MRVLILANNDIGLHNFRKELLLALLNRHYEVHIALPYGDFVDKMQEMGCIFHATEFDRRGTNFVQELKMTGMYKKIIRDVKPDVVLSYTIKPNVYGGMACASLHVPYIANITGLGTALGEKGILQFISIRLYRHAMRKASVLMFQNADNENFFRQHKIISGRSTRIPGSGVNLDKFKELPYPVQSAPEFLFISRILREKGIDEYLAMAERVKEKHPEVVFHILGFYEDEDESPDSYRYKIKNLEARGVVKFEGMQKDIIPFLTRAQCTIHPSFYPEGMSNVCLESAASARPVITTMHTGCQETVEEGVTGYLVPIQDVDKLTEAVEKFLNLSPVKREEMGKNGRNKMEREFSRKIVVDKYLEEINLAVQNKKNTK